MLNGRATPRFAAIFPETLTTSLWSHLNHAGVGEHSRCRAYWVSCAASSVVAQLTNPTAASVVRLRRDPRMLKLPPYLSLLCILVGVVWLFLLPFDQYSRRTYISENALLPGQVHTYFGGSDQNVFRAYKHEVDELVGKSNVEWV